LTGTKLTLWLVNPGPQIQDVAVEVHNGKGMGNLAATYWQGPEDEITPGNSGSLQIRNTAGGFEIVTLPADCIAKIALTVNVP
jgi:hypothetical protein